MYLQLGYYADYISYTPGCYTPAIALASSVFDGEAKARALETIVRKLAAACVRLQAATGPTELGSTSSMTASGEA